MIITRVTFTPRRKKGSISAAPLNCKIAEYFVPEENWAVAIELATKVFRNENPLSKYYDVIASNTRILNCLKS